MTIVAPTSAGKSTVINAIAGQDLLPSRNDAMTVLPTEIVFSRRVTRPKLILDKALMTLLREVWRLLHQIFQRIGLDEAIEQATKNDFPREHIIREIFNSSVFPLSEEVKSDDIQPALIKINDLLRLCGIFGISTEFLSSLSEIPRIEVPFPSLLSPLKDSGLGTVVLVDTPGPSEDKSLDLVNVVKDRLKASSLVLVVVDYTKIGQTDPAKVKKLVDEIAKVKGRDRIYIIVNKIDARDPNNPDDLTTQQILNLVKTKYEIDDPQNQVFEMSAVEAFLATNFQREKEIYELTELQKRKSFEALGQKYYANYWKIQKTTVTLKEMQEVAVDLLRDSGFVGFIDKAITPLVPTMITIKGALNDISQRFAGFLFCLSNQKGILERDIQQLEEQINVLEAELKEVISIYTSLQWQEKIISLFNSISKKLGEKRDKFSHNLTNEFIEFFDPQLDILWDRLIKFNIAEHTDRHYLIIVNPIYMNVSMLREIVNFNRICCIKINEIYDENVDKLHNLFLQFIEDVNYHLNSDNSFINKIQERMQKKLNQKFLLDKDKYTSYFQGIKEIVKKNCDAYEANISNYEERLKKYESSYTIVGNAKIYWGEDLPNFIHTGYTSYDPIETLNPYRYSRFHDYQNPTVVESLTRSIEISSVRISTTTSYDFYSFYQERVSKIRSACIEKKYPLFP
jgi:GTPase Era involved in 16S rRNA processing